MTSILAHHVRRQAIIDQDGNIDCWGFVCDRTAYIVKWVIVGVIFVLVLGFLIIGSYHAKRRMARGQAPLAYHRWLVSRSARARFASPSQQHPQYGFSRPVYVPGGQGQPQTYQMHNYGYPQAPPAYREGDAAPVYTPPTKIDPDQNYAVPPPGAPPGAANNFDASGPSQPPRVADRFGYR